MLLTSSMSCVKFYGFALFSSVCPRRAEASLALLQRTFRAQLALRLEHRERDVKIAWPATAALRQAILFLVYTAALVYIAGCVYILLIYGV